MQDINKMIMPMFSFKNTFSREPFVKGESIILTDINGKEYVDCISGIWNVPFGFSNKHIIDEICKQSNRLQFSNLYVAPADVTVEYANRLLEKLNGDFLRFAYTCSGSESTELAMKFCRKFQKLIGTERTAIGAFNYSYHGTTFGAMSVSGIDKEFSKDYLPLVPNINWIDVYENSDENAWRETISIFFDDYHDKLAGIIVEPIMGSGGVIEVKPEVLSLIKQKCDEYNIVLVFDEVATGFGRTGKMFAYQHSGVKPDLMCVSKAINNGYLPMGGVLIGSKVNDVFSLKDSFIEHFSTQNGNPIACAAALAVLDFMEDELFQQIEEKGAYLEKSLYDLMHSKNVMLSFRRKGMMMALEMRETTAGKYLNEEMLNNVLENCYRRRIIVHPFYNPYQNSGIMLYPAYISSYEQLDLMAEKISMVFNKIFK
ncbi:TPA: aspartate aminotransferase family protein [Escherichia coli]|nr:aspartate aminotransferase family protein [Escherichia coli]